MAKIPVAVTVVKTISDLKFELWNNDDEPYITIPNDGNFRIEEKNFKIWLSEYVYDKHNKTISSNAMQEALNILKAKALEGKSYHTYVRAAPFEDKIYVDLGRTDWKCVELSKDGWQIVDKVPVKFLRPKSLEPMPLPEKGGKWDDLRGLLNAKDDRTWKC